MKNWIMLHIKHFIYTKLLICVLHVIKCKNHYYNDISHQLNITHVFRTENLTDKWITTCLNLHSLILRKINFYWVSANNMSKFALLINTLLLPKEWLIQKCWNLNWKKYYSRLNQTVKHYFKFICHSQYYGGVLKWIITPSYAFFQNNPDIRIHTLYSLWLGPMIEWV